MPARPCSICTNQSVDEINGALLAPGRSVTAIANRYHVGVESLYRHNRTCIKELVEHNERLRMELSADSLLAKLNTWHERMEQQYANADATGNILATVATARAGIQAIQTAANIAILAEAEQRVQALEEGRVIDSYVDDYGEDGEDTDG